MPKARNRPVKNLGILESDRSQKNVIHIVCEGPTESGYFVHIARDILNIRNVKIYPQPGELGGMSRAVQRTIKFKQKIQPGDEIWLVLDSEGANNAEFSSAYALANQNKIACIITNPCIEYWFLLHYENSSGLFANCGEAEDKLKRLYISNYEKGYLAGVHFKRKQITDAMKRAKRIHERITAAEKFRETSSEIFTLLKHLGLDEEPYK